MNVTRKLFGCHSIIQRRPGIFAVLLLILLTGCKSRTQSESESSSSSSGDRLELVFTYGSEKEKWINVSQTDPTSSGNLPCGGCGRVTTRFLYLLPKRRYKNSTKKIDVAFVTNRCNGGGGGSRTSQGVETV